MSQAPTVSETMYECGPETPEFYMELMDRYALPIVAIALLIGVFL